MTMTPRQDSNCDLLPSRVATALGMEYINGQHTYFRSDCEIRVSRVLYHGLYLYLIVICWRFSNSRYDVLLKAKDDTPGNLNVHKGSIKTWMWISDTDQLTLTDEDKDLILSHCVIDVFK